MDKSWTTYLLECADGTWYCGVTNSLRKRVITHNAGKGAKYTRSRLPVALLAGRCGSTKAQAMRLEYQVKQQLKSKKIEFLKHAPVAQFGLERGATNAEVGDSSSSGCATFKNVIASVDELVEDSARTREEANSMLDEQQSDNREFFDEKGRKVFIHPMFEIATNPTIKISEIVKRWACRQGFVYIEMESEVEVV